MLLGQTARRLTLTVTFTCHTVAYLCGDCTDIAVGLSCVTVFDNERYVAFLI